MTRCGNFPLPADRERPLSQRAKHQRRASQTSTRCSYDAYCACRSEPTGLATFSTVDRRYALRSWSIQNQLLREAGDEYEFRAARTIYLFSAHVVFTFRSAGASCCLPCRAFCTGGCIIQLRPWGESMPNGRCTGHGIVGGRIRRAYGGHWRGETLLWPSSAQAGGCALRRYSIGARRAWYRSQRGRMRRASAPSVRLDPEHRQESAQLANDLFARSMHHGERRRE